MPSKKFVKFLILCLVWGLTWIGVKAGIEKVPPMIFAATRFIVAGIILLAFLPAARRKAGTINLKSAGRLAVASILMITLCYGPLFWGMQFISSGTAAVLEMSLTPLALLGFGVMLGEETWSWPKCVAMLVGIVGLYLLFGCPTGATSTSSILGWTAVGWAALSSAWGSVIARPLISQYGSQLVAGSTTVLGGMALLLVGIAAGEDLTFVLPFYWPWDAIGAWIFLVVFGSLVGYSLYIQLIDDIGPARAGSFAFVSPMIAVAVGAVVAGETVSLVNLGGMVLMLLSAGACLHADAFARPKPAPTTG